MKVDFKKLKSKDNWEKFISKQKYTSPFQSWNWATFEKNMGRNFERVGVFKKDKLVGLLPINKISALRGKYLHLRHGPVFDFEDKELWMKIISYLKKKACSNGYWFIRISPLIKKKSGIKYIKDLRKSPMHDVDAEITWVLNLDKSEKEILKQMRKNTRYYIRKAERDGVEIIRTKDRRYLKDFWRIYKETFERQKWHAYTREYIQKEFETFIKDDMIELYLARFKGKFIAGSLIVYYMNQAIYHHSGTLSKYRKIPASYLIQWEAIREAKKRGLSIYNFWGISPLVNKDGRLTAEKGHPWEGLTFFKMGFGGKAREFIHARDIPVSPIYYLTRFYESMERWRRGY